MTKRQILEIVAGRYISERAAKVMNLRIFLDKQTSIPEHTDFTGSIDEIIVQIAELDDKIETIEQLIKEDFNA